MELKDNKANQPGDHPAEPKQAKAAAYVVPKGEEGFVHAIVWKKEFDPDTGQPKFTPFTQKYSPSEWRAFLEFPGGFVVNEIKHLPEGSPTPEQFVQEQAAKAEKRAKK